MASTSLIFPPSPCPKHPSPSWRAACRTRRIWAKTSTGRPPRRREAGRQDPCWQGAVQGCRRRRRPRLAAACRCGARCRDMEFVRRLWRRWQRRRARMGGGAGDRRARLDAAGGFRGARGRHALLGQPARAHRLHVAATRSVPVRGRVQDASGATLGSQPPCAFASIPRPVRPRLFQIPACSGNSRRPAQRVAQR